jgi:glutamyl-tRNA synthetase
MHLGNARTALLARLQTGVAGGRCALRIEDLDRDRCRPEWEAALREDLAWLGLEWDIEAARQSTRAAAYEAAIATLARTGHVYECYCSRAEVRAASAPHGPADDGPVYAGTCRSLTEHERTQRRGEGRRAALRLRVEPGVVAFHDLVRGAVEQDVASTVGDLVIRRSDGVHAYQLAVVVDDAELGVTDVLRGDDLLGSTPRQILLQRLLGLPTPRYAHVPLLYADSGERLAKRHGGATIRALREAGTDPAELARELLEPVRGLVL